MFNVDIESDNKNNVVYADQLQQQQQQDPFRAAACVILRTLL